MLRWKVRQLQRRPGASAGATHPTAVGQRLQVARARRGGTSRASDTSAGIGSQARKCQPYGRPPHAPERHPRQQRAPTYCHTTLLVVKQSCGGESVRRAAALLLGYRCDPLKAPQPRRRAPPSPAAAAAPWPSVRSSWSSSTESCGLGCSVQAWRTRCSEASAPAGSRRHLRRRRETAPVKPRQASRGRRTAAVSRPGIGQGPHPVRFASRWRASASAVFNPPCVPLPAGTASCGRAPKSAQRVAFLSVAHRVAQEGVQVVIAVLLGQASVDEVPARWKSAPECQACRRLAPVHRAGE